MEFMRIVWTDLCDTELNGEFKPTARAPQIKVTNPRYILAYAFMTFKEKLPNEILNVLCNRKALTSP